MACLQSLFLSDPRDDLAAIRSAKGKRVDGTCDWILAQDSYTSWLIEDSPQLLWLSGGPGIGKTMISTFMVEELARLAERSSQITLAYYFCDDKDEKRKTATAILRGLLLQLLRQRPMLFKHIQSDFDISRDNLFTSFHGLWRVFDAIVKDPEAGEVFCLIDALDECDKELRQSFLSNFTELFTSLQNKISTFRFIVTSRRESDIEELFSAASPAIQNLQVDSRRVNDDLSKFIDFKVDKLSEKKGYRPKQKDRIKRALTEKAGGTFLYVSLVVQDLEKVTISENITKKLENLPLGLNDVYDRILSQINADCEETAKLVLRWVAVARRPLTVDELAMARAVGAEECEGSIMPPEDLLDELKDGFKCCEPLVYIDTENNTVNLIHQSAKDYLLSTYLQGNRDLSRYHIVTDRTNLLVFQTCWTYLGLEEFKNGTMLVERDEDHRLEEQYRYFSKRVLKGHCFLQYAIKEWRKHALVASLALITGNGFGKENLDKLPTLRDIWLLKAAADGQEVVVQWLLNNCAELNSEDKSGKTPLSLAAAKGHEAVVKLLLSRDDVAADSPDEDDWTPLFWAAMNGHEAVVKLLLSRDDVAADSQQEGGRTPLSWAAANGHEAVVKLLLGRDDVAVDSRNDDGWTPLSLAAENGHKAVVKLLLGRDDVAADSRDEDGRTPLFWAAVNGHEAVVKLLLSRDVEADPKDKYGRTPLSSAAAKGHEAVVKLLISRDDVAADPQDEHGRTPLFRAAVNGHEAVVKLLLSRDVEADPKVEHGTPLSSATLSGHEAEVKLLLSQDTEADPKDADSRTPLSWAAANGHEAVVKLLLSRGVEADPKEKHGRTPLSWAAANGHEAVVKLLLSRDVEADPKDRRSRTPLSWAAANGHEAVVKLLLSRDVEADPKGKHGWTPIFWAARNGHKAVVKLLLSRDVEADRKDKYGRTPLSLAAGRGHEAVVELLKQKMRDASNIPGSSTADNSE